MLIDLQVHSTYSDGYLSPTEMVNYLAKQGVRVASLTDHNTVAGNEEFRLACKKHNIKPIAGLELYVKLGRKKMNILWFNFNENEPALHAVLRDSQIRRRARARKILNKLKEVGLSINVNKILDKYTHYIPVNHLVDEIWSVPSNRTLIKKILNNKTPREGDMINEFFYNKKIGKFYESYISIERILKLRKKIGGQLILNHPGKYNHLQKDFLEKLKKLGIDGMEVMSPHHSIGAVVYSHFMARELDFIGTGGSDFHRFEGNDFPVQSSWDYFKIDTKDLRNIKKIIG